ncbi:MAG: PDZ domain-containing protein, partial [Myxococcota bacterium]|nr:PDZ domain-containing protein [Myxococcota bacterium]
MQHRRATTTRVLFLSLGACCLLATLSWVRFSLAQEAPPDQGDLLERALNRIERLYLHPEVIDPPAMARRGIQAMERAGPDLLVLEEDSASLLVQSGTRRQVFTTEDVDSLDSAGEKVRSVASFMAAEPAEAGDDGPSEEDLHVEALRGMLGTIDRHSRLIVGGKLDDFNTRFKGTLVGIGARIGRRQGRLTVIDTFSDAPAGQSGLLAGDAITHIDGHATTALSVEDAVERIRGPEGVPVVLTVERDEEEGRRIFVIVRAKVLVPSVK